MRKWLDQDEGLSELIRNLSNGLAKQQGLIPVIGIAAAVLGLLFLLANVFVGNSLLAFLGILLQGGGIIAALIGLLLIEPLGQ